MFIVDNFIAVLSKFGDFSGRASRAEYWYFVLANFLIGVGMGFMGGATQNPLFVTVNNIYSITILVPAIAVGIRRMHDIGKSGWFILIPIYNLILACTEGEAGPNMYGPNPANETLPPSATTSVPPTPTQSI